MEVSDYMRAGVLGAFSRVSNIGDNEAWQPTGQTPSTLTRTKAMQADIAIAGCEAGPVLGLTFDRQPKSAVVEAKSAIDVGDVNDERVEPLQHDYLD